MPTPRENESREDFVKRCIPIVLDDKAAEDNKQAVAVCNSMWEQAMEEQEPGGPEKCICPECDYEAEKERGIPCRSMKCPECGASLVAGDTEQEAATMPFTDVRQIAQSAIEVGLAFLTGDTKVKQADGLRLLEALEKDLAALGEATKTVDGKPRPAGDFLVVGDPDKVDTWHLPVKRNGKPDHNLMGAAKAALTAEKGHRGNPYEGPGKEEAIRKLKALYKAEDMEWSESEPLTLDIATDLLAELDEMRDRLARFVQGVDGGDIEADGQAVEVARDATEDDLSEVDAAIEAGRRAPVVVDFQILQPGPGNKRQNHYYPADIVRRDIHVFEGADVFATDHKEAERSERTKVGKVLSCPTRFTESDAPVAQVLLYDPHQAEKARNRADAGALGTLECSIFGSGKAKPGEVDGKEYKIVEAITEGKFLELVSKAGAGGRAIGLAENQTGGVEMEKEEKAEAAPVEEVEIEESEAEVEPKPLDSDAVVKGLAETNLPKFAVAYLKAREYADEAELQEAIKEALAEVKEISGSGQVTGLGEAEQPQEVALTPEEHEQRRVDAFNEVMREIGLSPV